jgi:hypothetical protein
VLQWASLDRAGRWHRGRTLSFWAMPFTLQDLDRISVRVGMGTKTLRAMSDTQFTAWLRAQGARGNIGVVKSAPGELVIPIEERVRVLNDLEGEGFYIPDVMGSKSATSGPNAETLERTWRHLSTAREELQEVEAAIAELGEIDPRVNLRMSIHGALELVELMRGAVEHAKRTAS